MNDDELPAYIKISVDAVGGADSPEGKEMERLLLERAGEPERTVAIAEPIEKVNGDESILGATLEGLFSQEFTRNELS